MACTNCGVVGPPPDMILSMPPPPLPSFLLPRSAIVALSGNESQPCFAAFMCEPNPRPREGGIEFIELAGKGGHITMANTWLFVLISSCVGVLVLGTLLAVILMKCRDYSFSYHESNLKQSSMPALGEPSKSNPFLSGGMLYPCASNRDSLQQQLANDNRLLWATLTPHGTRHFVSEFPAQESHYEVVDYKAKPQTAKPSGRDTLKRVPVKSFDNNGFVDYDYEDPTPLMDSYHDDLDSGYQEPHEVIGTLSRSSPRPLVSSPTRIENPNIPPLNMYPHNRNPNGTLNKKTTLSRRISDASSYSAAGM
ncbi:uncharacterized protein LOC119658338 [Hermetia illucens]|uniref:uncharacterized protein LOC119658338 n=1 Tax=Hermetia illucens TaxID=343691 RepID=UPI0018CC2461|nr:uncharacterized protein LOC119658338 [Hermetia illucens]XP_037921612.1 uncharacterized protein LOC119658338 [Hermetia illucens]XP_037921613.1 uncharacterized protein LOC119658338 [Hermetia illucens]